MSASAAASTRGPTFSLIVRNPSCADAAAKNSVSSASARPTVSLTTTPARMAERTGSGAGARSRSAPPSPAANE